MTERKERSIADALRIAAKDASFAQDFVANPEDYRQIYRLSDAQITEIKNTKVSDVLRHIRQENGGAHADYY